LLPVIVPLLDWSNSLTEVNIEEIVVISTLKVLKTSSSPGPDGIHPILLSNLSNQVGHPLSLIYNFVFKNETLPSEWKIRLVKPFFKKGSSSEPNNYRPISLTCIVCKLFESIIKDATLIIHLNSHRLITKDQHGFLKRHSTVTSLLECVIYWNSSLNNRACVDILYLDFSKRLMLYLSPNSYTNLKVLV